MLSFEDQLAALQQIVSALESGQLGLEDSLARFEEGIGLLRQCQDRLNSARQQIELLTGFDAAGQPLTQPFDATATFTEPGAATTSKPAASPPTKRAARRATTPEPTPPPSTPPTEDPTRRLF
jgi:exodeoxyribonuclease VII small subunit